MDNWGDGHMDDGWGLAMLLGMLSLGVLIALAVGLAAVWAIRSARPSAGTVQESTPGSTMRSVTGGAEQILAERMARGEIDIEEYDARRAALGTRGLQRPPP